MSVFNHYLEMQEHFLYVPYYHHHRRVRVLLPKDYHNEPWQHYPVLYMHDGQNVFYSKESYSGHSWKIIPTIKHYQQLPKLIIVGIDNAGEERLNEYAPWKTEVGHSPEVRNVGGRGAEYADWVVNEVKKFIDENYRTLPNVEHTLLAGSSMGGIITAYMGAAYPQVFGHFGVFSLASWFSEGAFMDFIHRHPLQPQSRVFIQVGTNEGDEMDSQFISNMNQTYIDCTLRYYQALLRTGQPLDHIRLRIMANEIHHEMHWADHFVEFLHFALLNK
ncbi:alpha/beta hydrolase [Avibacterium paragallinarum]|uniref:Hydrolase n=1 Tax=Avibacterium paragallinarum TaxID=728 RepID=A0A377I5R7_AVIPA|nr:alpha/beta hydrolase-fold protein [Avibacterium paragallinarum]POY45708.1 alpha/beta hydrolase [Avibacterium paragallinarum]RZN59927.1 alpha/beta hydrolase [Avibacterium paragallinarum]RZN74891.1 alpha/beta hydrolase [Avibacterium paragallinarum]TID17292.1 esterase [Avibacterium paragallinarum]STO70614.1 hydrolase [Avibacterium paragallinarum]